MRSRKKWLVAYLAIFTFVLSMLSGCGSNSSTNGNTSSNTSSSDNNNSSGNTSIKFTGDFQGALTGAGSCGVSMGDYKAIWYQNIGSDFYSFQILVTHYNGPSQYTTGPGEGPPTVGLTNQSNSKGFYSQYSSATGTITVNSGETSGTLNVTLTSDDKSKTTTVSGAWTCTKF
jgi:hypothetical protein